MTTSNVYEVVYANKYRLGDFVKNITVEDNLDEIALRVVIQLEYTDELPQLVLGGRIRVSGTPYGLTVLKPILYYGVIWDIESDDSGQKEIVITAYDLSIYLKSEEEFIFQPNMTASQRFKEYVKACKLPLGDVEDTKIKLGKAVYRARPIFEMIREDLKETVLKGGDFYRVLMTEKGLSLKRLGQNKDVYIFETDKNIERITQKRTLDGAITQVKIVGVAEDDKKSPIKKVLTGDTQYGTIQKIITEEVEQASKTKEKDLKAIAEKIRQLDEAGNYDEAIKILRELGKKVEGTSEEDTIAKLEAKGDVKGLIGLLQKIATTNETKGKVTNTKDMTDVAKNMLQGAMQTYTFITIDVNTLRAGDKIRLNGMDLYICNIKHELGDVGRMTITASTKDYIKRSFYQ